VVTDPDVLHTALAKAAGGKIEIGLVRGVSEIAVTVHLAAGPANKAN
jgi:hypothetical protein